MLDVVIIGSGPAGLSAAIYATRANLDAVVLEKEYLGTGQIAYSSRVDNYPGLPGKDGYSLGEAFLEHAEGLGVTIEEAEVTAITKKEQSFVISCEDGKNIEAKTVVYAAGCQNRRLGVPGEAKLLATGVSFCAVCDGAFYLSLIHIYIHVASENAGDDNRNDNGNAGSKKRFCGDIRKRTNHKGSEV